MADHSFCRTLLTETLTDVVRDFSAEEINKTWVISVGKDRYEFHGPNKFYSIVKGDCAASAKAEGWSELLSSKSDSEEVELAESERNSS